MVRYVAAALFLVCAFAQPAAADRWVFVNSPGDYKFGYEPSGTQNFSTIWFACANGNAVANAAVGNSYPPSGQGAATLSAAGEIVTVQGYVPNEDYDGVYSLEATLQRDHPVFRLIGSGQPIAYRSAGWDRRLVAAGQKTSVEQFWTACR